MREPGFLLGTSAGRVIAVTATTAGRANAQEHALSSPALRAVTPYLRRAGVGVSQCQEIGYNLSCLVTGPLRTQLVSS